MVSLNNIYNVANVLLLNSIYCIDFIAYIRPPVQYERMNPEAWVVLTPSSVVMIPHEW